MAKTDSRRGTITPEHEQEAARLSKLYAEHEPERRRLKMTQAEFGKKFGIGGQSAVTNMLNAHMALSMKGAIGFARAFSVPISSFSPRLALEAKALMTDLAETLGLDRDQLPCGPGRNAPSPGALHIATLYDSIPDDEPMKDVILATVRTVAGRAVRAKPPAPSQSEPAPAPKPKPHQVK